MNNIDNEHWKDIDGYDGMYQVSDLGRVRSRKRGEWKVRKLCNDKYGYLQLLLSKNGKIKHFYVHRLVAQAFIPNDDETKTQINHRNECKSENKVSNLEYCTAQYNMTYNDIHHRRKRRKQYFPPNYKRDKVKDLYNPNLTYEQNLEIFKANGIECSEKTVYELRKELGLTRKHKFRNKLQDLYDPNLSYDENLKVFKENGVECSKKVIFNLRQDLGLIK